MLDFYPGKTEYVNASTLSLLILLYSVLLVVVVVVEVVT